jgi:hypothetical protein
MQSSDRPDDLALRALTELTHGDPQVGLQFYERALASAAYSVPVGMHLMHLKGQGLHDVAAHVEALALRNNGDLAMSWSMHRFQNPRRAIEEYERLIQEGRVNALMIHRYMVCLSLVGDAARLAAITASPQLFHQSMLPVAGVSGEFFAEVHAALAGSERRRFSEAEYAARGLDRVHRAHELSDPVLVDLHRAVRAQVKRYVQSLSGCPHPFASWIPPQFELRSWAVMSDGKGQLEPHIHSGCWVCGVVFIAGQAGEPGTHSGYLRVGAAPDGDAACPGWPDVHVAPVPGRIVIMPSFYTHWVVPMADAGPRVSVAFNVVAA